MENAKQRKWKPEIGDEVLVKCQPTSDALQGVIGKFRRPFDGPYVIRNFVPPAMYEICDGAGKMRGLFHLTHMKPYRRELETEKSD